MKLLIVTQALDLDDPTLSVYHGWVAALAQRSESVIAICLKEGRHDLPANVHVYSLGKEKGSASAAIYTGRFLSLAWKLRREYDRVFVHMNQEYILIAGWLWKLLRKPIYMWRNHYAGSLLTDIAAGFCVKVFCTSKHSYTAKYAKTMLMPVGVDLDRFGDAGINDTVSAAIERVPNSILFLARMAPSKRPEMLLEALAQLQQKGVPFTATFIGTPLPENEEYYAKLKKKVLAQDPENSITFQLGIPSADAPAAYRTHEIFVNTSRSGMFDKTIFEAAASGCLVLASSEDFKDAAGTQYYFINAEELAGRLTAALARSEDDRTRDRTRMYALARAENLATLCDSLARELYS